MWLPPIEARLAVYAYSVAAIISGFGISIPVRNARVKWKILEKENSGRESALEAVICFVLIP
jgi:hypothetical protein